LQIPRAPKDGAPSPRFGLSLLGGFELTGPDGVVDLPSKKLADLLAYRACNASGPHLRQLGHEQPVIPAIYFDRS